MTRGILPATLALVLAVSAAQGDGLLFSFEGDILPGDPGTDIVIANPCEPGCSRRLENGHFLLEWGAAGDLVNYSHTIADVGEIPPPTLWVEWSFRSNQMLTGSTSCDGEVAIDYLGNFDTANMFQNAVVDFEGGDFVLGLDPNVFHTHRFENSDGVNYTFAVDGVVYNADMDLPSGIGDFLQFGGRGNCADPRPLTVRNEWDFIRYGTIETGEAVVSSDPPAGDILFPVDRFRVTFDNPNYAYVDDISVAVTGGVAPHVIATRRLDNGTPDVLEVVLDTELPVDATTTFTFTDPSGDQDIVYTVVRSGSCCVPSGSCAETTEPDCTTGTFLPGATCEGDTDADGVDGTCGDACPADPDNDVDGDGICGDVDDCPLLNPNDANNDGAPDCQAIPTVSTWGLVVMTLVLIAGGVLLRRRQGA